MPIDPDYLAGIVAALLSLAAGGGYGVARLQLKSASASSVSENCADTCVALDRVGEKIDSLSRKMDNMGLAIRASQKAIDELRFEFDHEVKPQLHQAIGRLEALESRSLPNRPIGPT